MITYARFLAFSIIGSVMLLPLLVLPAMVGILVDEGGLSEATAGWLAALGAIGGAGISLVMAVRMHRIPPRKVAFIAITCAVILDALSAFNVGATTFFFALRLASGLATTMAYVLAIASFARFDAFERGYGLFVTLQFLISGIGLYLLPVYASEIGADGMYLIFAAAGVVALGMATFLPTTAPLQDPPGDNNRAPSRNELRVLLSVATAAAVFGFAAFEMANNAQFTFVERFGVSIGLIDEEIGYTLLIASLIGIPAAFLIVLMGDRFGILAPLGFGMGMAVVGLLIFIFDDSYTGYFIGSCFMGFSWAFCLPFIQAFLASLDREGSALAAGSTASTLGAAAGPAVAASIVGEGQYGAVFAAAIFMFAVSIALFVISRVSVARQKRVVTQ